MSARRIKVVRSAPHAFGCATSLFGLVFVTVVGVVFLLAFLDLSLSALGVVDRNWVDENGQPTDLSPFLPLGFGFALLIPLFMGASAASETYRLSGLAGELWAREGRGALELSERRRFRDYAVVPWGAAVEIEGVRTDLIAHPLVGKVNPQSQVVLTGQGFRFEYAARRDFDRAHYDGLRDALGTVQARLWPPFEQVRVSAAVHDPPPSSAGD